MQQACSPTRLHIVREQNSGDSGLRRQPCRPRDASPVKWGSLQPALLGLYFGQMLYRQPLGVVATHNLSLLSAPSFFAKPSKLHHDGTQFLFSSSENFYTSAALDGLIRASDDVALWVRRYLLVFRAVYHSATLGMVEEKLWEVLTGVWSNDDGIRGARRGAVNLMPE
ncbi:hypothetical protein M3J09_005674 [Ascochyta lentis]